jgi:hypothetical protein
MTRYGPGVTVLQSKGCLNGSDGYSLAGSPVRFEEAE